MATIAALAAPALQTARADPTPHSVGAKNAGTELTISYQGSSANIANPERGFFHQSEGAGDPIPTPSDGSTVVRYVFRLDAHRRSLRLPTSYLTTVRMRFAEARRKRIKLIVRFAYNYSAVTISDAPLPTVLSHIRQLGPLLRDNRDVIMSIDAGFVGQWGEWHDSSNGLDRAAPAAQIIRQELAEFPAGISIALRYPRHKIRLFGSTPTSADEALSALVPKSRVGFHNDCFLAGATDGFTWENIAQRQYMAADTASVPMTGETCVLDSIRPAYTNCRNARTQLARYHWTALNADYHPGILNGWRSGGCMNDIQKRLGYRLRLLDVTSQTDVAAGGLLALSARILNEGYAAPINSRPVEVVLRSRSTGATTLLRTRVDARHWGPGTTTADLGVSVPPDHPPGDYDVLLRLPDPSATLADKPQYSVRLANDGLWEPGTGMNALRFAVLIHAS